MPNWTENYVEVSGEPDSIKDFKHFVESDKSVFTFNNIVPMPPALNVDASDDRYQEGIKALNDRKFHQMPAWKRRQCRLIFRNLMTYRKYNWYDWRYDKWGTRSEPNNVYLEYDSECQLAYSFLTAWSGPKGVAEALRAIFPDLEIKWRCLDEENWTVRNEAVEDEDADNAWITPCLDRNPNTYEI